MEIGRFYSKEVTIQRRLTIQDSGTRFDTTAQVPEALHRLTEAYLGLGLNNEATKTAAILGYNYGNEWYQDSYSILKTGN